MTIVHSWIIILTGSQATIRFWNSKLFRQFAHNLLRCDDNGDWQWWSVDLMYLLVKEKTKPSPLKMFTVVYIQRSKEFGILVHHQSYYTHAEIVNHWKTNQLLSVINSLNVPVMSLYCCKITLPPAMLLSQDTLLKAQIVATLLSINIDSTNIYQFTNRTMWWCSQAKAFLSTH